MLSKYYFIFIVLFLTGCSLQPPLPECRPLKDIAYYEDFRSNEYQAIVRNHIISKSPSDYRYIFSEFYEREEKTFMYLKFINEEECFFVKMIIDKWDKLGGFKKVNGKSYPKEFINLTWTAEKNEFDYYIKYSDMDVIID